MNEFIVPWTVYAVAYTPWVVALVGGLYLGLRAVRALERRAGVAAELAALQERTLRLEETLSTLSEQVQRLADGQDFTAKLLAERK